MNGIGITQWQDNESNWPLRQAGSLGGLFCDASFVTYNAFIPVLQSMAITSAGLVLNIQFDDGVTSFVATLSQAVQGAALRLRNNGRYYGVVVFGRKISDVMAGVFGSSINANLSFNPMTARSINGSNGIYSINNFPGAVVMIIDRNMWFTSNQFNTAAIPSYTSAPAQPLKSINSVTVDAANNIAIATDQALQIQAESDTLQFSLTVQDANLNVKRNVQYT